MRSDVLRNCCVVTTLGSFWLVGCSLADLDRLNSGHSGTGGESVLLEGGSTSIAGRSGVSAGAAGRTASPALGGASTGTTLPIPQGGNGNPGIGGAGIGGVGVGGAGVGASAAVGGATTDPTPVGTAGAAGLCPANTEIIGKLLTPPSNGFETDALNWTTKAQRPNAISTSSVTGACERNSFLTCQGAQRSAEWDGPALEVISYTTVGRTYGVSVAARFDPNEPAPSVKLLRLSAAVTCSDTTYSHLNEKVSNGSWVRLGGIIRTDAATCPTPRSIIVYVETDVGAKTSSIQIDDFQLYEIASDSNGTAGASGVAGAAGSAGTNSGGASGFAGATGNVTTPGASAAGMNGAAGMADTLTGGGTGSS